MKFFFDRSVPIGIVRVIAFLENKHKLVHQDEDDRFEPDDDDPHILGLLARERPRPVFITVDAGMRRKDSIERRALNKSGLTVIFLRKAFLAPSDIWSQAIKALQAWPKIVKATRSLKQPTGFEVTAKAKLENLGPTEKL